MYEKNKIKLHILLIALAVASVWLGAMSGNKLTLALRLALAATLSVATYIGAHKVGESVPDKIVGWFSVVVLALTAAAFLISAIIAA